jgi:hypothetical protein
MDLQPDRCAEEIECTYTADSFWAEGHLGPNDGNTREIRFLLKPQGTEPCALSKERAMTFSDVPVIANDPKEASWSPDPGYANDVEASAKAVTAVSHADRKALGLASDGNDPFKPSPSNVFQAAIGTAKSAVYYFAKSSHGNKRELIRRAYGPNTGDMECGREETSENLKSMQGQCEDPKKLDALAGPYKCELAGAKEVTLELQAGSHVYVVPSKAGKFTEEMLPFLDKTKIKVKGLDAEGPTPSDTFEVEVSADNTAQITFGKAQKCTGTAEGTPPPSEGMPWWAILLIVGAVVLVVVVGFVVLISSGRDTDEDDDDDDDSSSDENDTSGTP